MKMNTKVENVEMWTAWGRGRWIRYIRTNSVLSPMNECKTLGRNGTSRENSVWVEEDVDFLRSLLQLYTPPSQDAMLHMATVKGF